MAGHDNAEKASSSHNHHLRRRRVNFPVGSAVEVNTDEEGLENVYFSATVIPSPPTESRTSRRLFVEYTNLLSSDAGSDPLREPVKLAFLRPKPPPEDNRGGFEPGDVVDAFYKDGWWTGVVARPAESHDRFIVSFDDPPDELEFGLDELRAHWDWTNRKWVRPKSKARVTFGVGRRVEVSFDGEEFQDAWFPATVEKNLEDREFVVEYRSSNGESMKAKVDSRHIRPCPPLFMPKNSIILMEKVCAFFDHGWWDGEITKELENNQCVVFFKQFNRDMEFDSSELRPHMEWKNGEWWLLDDWAHEKHDTPDQNSAATPGSMNGSESLSSRPKRRQYQSDSGSTALKKHKEGSVSPGTANYLKICAVEMMRDQSLCISSLEGKKFEMPTRVRSKRVGRNPKRLLLRGDEERAQEDSAGLDENHLSGQEERNDITKQVVVEIQDCHKGKVMEIDGVPDNNFDEEPLAKLIHEIVSPTLIDDPTNQCFTENEMQLLPFTKDTDLWKTVESKEVFKRLPQKPHFKPLEQYTESLREGLALGHMVTFANIVERISKLQVNEDTMETLSVLETHGFDVQVVRECVTKLLAAKDRGEKLQEEVNNLKSQILEGNREKTRIKEESREIKEQMKKLQVKLDFAEAARGKKEEEIESLQARLDEAEKNMKNATGDVEGSVYLF